jgi:TRAP-type C4-dicarboxylate transport system permease small subunit
LNGVGGHPSFFLEVCVMSLSGFYHGMDKVQKRIAMVERVFGMIAMAFIILINVFGISSRYLFDQPIIYVKELTILGAVWLFLVFKGHADITVEFLVRLLPRRWRMINDVMVDVMILFFLVFLAWQTWKFIPYTRGTAHVMSFALELPDEIYFYPIGIGAISIFLTVFHDFVGRLAKFRSRWEGTPQRGGRGK